MPPAARTTPRITIRLCDTNEPGKKRLEASFGFDTHHMNSRNDEAEKHPRIDVRRTRKETCVP
jgi:hypothetical protein